MLAWPKVLPSLTCLTFCPAFCRSFNQRLSNQRLNRLIFQIPSILIFWTPGGREDIADMANINKQVGNYTKS